ncbi:hypothetical protein [Pseudomonas asplenii]|uniref:hypothetical protein n=1 Tax=Pseudomonas asplenii TaxID=53407 RepID=UPI0022343E6B|nr:hypothetical protein [Pseudomonas asplenii]UZE26892.1 hypothetical protein LOY63_15985 [Pseudomonas asplenii]
MRKVTALLLLPVLVSGCSSFKKLLGDDPYAGYAMPAIDETSLKPWGEIKRLLTQSPSPLIESRCFNATVAGTDKEACRTGRNQAVQALVLGSENMCVVHRKSIYGNDAAFNITAGTFTNLFAGAATVSTVQTTKSVLSALALLSNAERSLVNETVYKQMLVTAVDKKIVAQREAKASQIANKLKLDYDQYNINQALMDFTDFHNSCSFMNGLRATLEEGTNDSHQQKIARLRANLTVAGAEKDVHCPKNAPAAAATSDSQQCTEAKARISAISTALKTLEIE